MDLDQALHLERDGDGYLVHYAIADVAAFVAPGDPVDVEAQRARRDALRRRLQGPAAPDRCSPRARPRCCPTRCGRPCCGRSTVDAHRRGHRRRRSSGRWCASRAKLDYDGVQRPIDDGSADEMLGAAPRGRRAAAGAGGRARRRLAAAARAGGRRRAATSWQLEFRLAAAGRAVERPDLAADRLRGRLADGLRAGRAAAHPAAARPPRRTAAAPHRPRPRHRVAGRASSTPTSSASLDPSVPPPTPRWSWPAPGCCAAAGYVAFDGEVPAQPEHAALASEYAHVTAPLRRLGRPLRRRDLRRAVRRHGGARLGAARLPTCPRRCASPARGRTSTRAPSSTWSRPRAARPRRGNFDGVVVVDAATRTPERGRCAARADAAMRARSRQACRAAAGPERSRRARRPTRTLATRVAFSDVDWPSGSGSPRPDGLDGHSLRSLLDQRNRPAGRAGEERAVRRDRQIKIPLVDNENGPSRRQGAVIESNTCSSMESLSARRWRLCARPALCADQAADLPPATTKPVVPVPSSIEDPRRLGLPTPPRPGPPV